MINDARHVEAASLMINGVAKRSSCIHIPCLLQRECHTQPLHSICRTRRAIIGRPQGMTRPKISNVSWWMRRVHPSIRPSGRLVGGCVERPALGVKPLLSNSGLDSSATVLSACVSQDVDVDLSIDVGRVSKKLCPRHSR